MTDQNERVLDQFSRQASAYAELVNGGDRQLRADPLIDLMALQCSDRVLDVGCGSGQLAVAIATLVAEVTGVDLTPAMLDEARAHAATRGAANIRWRLADSIALPFKDASFDVVVSRSMFHHAASPAATLAEMRRVCAPGGRVFVSDLSPEPSKSPAFDAIELLRDPSHQHALTVDELRQLGQSCGLEEAFVHSSTTRLPLEAVLATSFPPDGMLDHVRALLTRDAATGTDVFGMKAELCRGELWVSYPTTTIGWYRDCSPKRQVHTGVGNALGDPASDVQR